MRRGAAAGTDSWPAAASCQPPPTWGKIARVIWQRRWPRWFLLVGVWTLPGLYFAIQVYLQHVYEARPITLAQALLPGSRFLWLLWVISSPLILWLARTFPIPRREWLDGLLFHAPVGFHFFIHPSAPLRRHFVPAGGKGVWPDSAPGAARRIPTGLPLEHRLVEPDLLDDSPHNLRFRLLQSLSGRPNPGLASRGAGRRRGSRRSGCRSSRTSSSTP